MNSGSACKASIPLYAERIKRTWTFEETGGILYFYRLCVSCPDLINSFHEKVMDFVQYFEKSMCSYVENKLCGGKNPASEGIKNLKDMMHSCKTFFAAGLGAGRSSSFFRNPIYRGLVNITLKCKKSKDGRRRNSHKPPCCFV